MIEKSLSVWGAPLILILKRPEDWHTPLQALDPLPQPSLHEWSWPFQHFVDCLWWGWGCDNHCDLWLFEIELPPWPPWRGWRTALGKPQEERPSYPSSSPHWSGPNKDGDYLFWETTDPKCQPKKAVHRWQVPAPQPPRKLYQGPFSCLKLMIRLG